MGTFGQSFYLLFIFRYLTVDFSNNEFGDLDIMSGTFTVGKRGIYKFRFNSNICRMNSPSSDFREFLIKVNDTCCASESYGLATTCNDDVYNTPITILFVMLLKAGEKVGVFPCSGPLNEDATNNYVTQFSCVYVADNSVCF